jgi:hypothetical protein
MSTCFAKIFVVGRYTVLSCKEVWNDLTAVGCNGAGLTSAGLGALARVHQKVVVDGVEGEI